MKRATELVPLSREHHEALVLARRAGEPHRPGAEPAALREAGATQAADEALAQHARVRECVERLRLGDCATLAARLDPLQELPCTN